MRRRGYGLLVVGCWLLLSRCAVHAAPQPVDATVPDEAFLAYARAFNPAMFFAYIECPGDNLGPGENEETWRGQSDEK